MDPDTNKPTPPRIPLDVDVVCRAPGHGSLSYQAMNLSEGGIFLKSPFPLEVGTPVTCTFRLPDGLPSVVADGEVAWTRTGPPEQLPAPGMGIRFNGLDEVDGERLKHHVAWVEKELEAEPFDPQGPVPGTADYANLAPPAPFDLPDPSLGVSDPLSADPTAVVDSAQSDPPDTPLPAWPRELEANAPLFTELSPAVAPPPREKTPPPAETTPPPAETTPPPAETTPPPPQEKTLTPPRHQPLLEGGALLLRGGDELELAGVIEELDDAGFSASVTLDRLRPGEMITVDSAPKDRGQPTDQSQGAASAAASLHARIAEVSWEWQHGAPALRLRVETHDAATKPGGILTAPSDAVAPPNDAVAPPDDAVAPPDDAAAETADDRMAVDGAQTAASAPLPPAPPPSATASTKTLGSAAPTPGAPRPKRKQNSVPVKPKLRRKRPRAGIVDYASSPPYRKRLRPQKPGRKTKKLSRGLMTLMICFALVVCGALAAIAFSSEENGDAQSKQKAVPKKRRAAQTAHRPSGAQTQPRATVAFNPHALKAQKSSAGAADTAVDSRAPDLPQSARGAQAGTAETQTGQNPAARNAADKAQNPARNRKQNGPRLRRRGGKYVLELPASAKPAKITHYRLANPDGVVVDLHGVKPTLKAGRHTLSNRHVRMLKVLTKAKNARYIVYFNASMPKNAIEIQKTSAGGALRWPAPKRRRARKTASPKRRSGKKRREKRVTLAH